MLGTVVVFSFWWLFLSLPRPLFDDPYSLVMLDRNEALLSAGIAKDGQWRFPPSKSIPYKYEQALLCFEDQYFYRHPGINPLSIIRAAVQNYRSKRLVSGASTISMQVIRMAKKRKGRALSDKILEAFLAIRLELRFSKKEILSLHAAHAPFGGNVVGLEAASWRYFARSPHQLSWAESALLAVLPNAPNLMHPGKNRSLLLEKRNRLLARLAKKSILDSETYHLALLEPLPEKPQPLPSLTRHLAAHFRSSGHSAKLHTTIDKNLQVQSEQIVQNHSDRLAQNGISNACALIVDVRQNTLLSYVGNVNRSKQHAPDVDIIRAQRSSGSILKPFLFAAAQQSGLILPKTLLPDIPTQIAGFIPNNFNKNYDGAVPADEALSRSLNIPAVGLLLDYGLHNFYNVLKALGLSGLTQTPDHYGLSLILGGAEVSLWDLASAYTAMARQLNAYHHTDVKKISHYDKIQPLKNPKQTKPKKTWEVFDAGAIWLTFQALTNVNKPRGYGMLDFMTPKRRIAWKTGTSYGFRDAWAIGVTPDYVVAVWVGNADGEGRPGLLGVEAAAPLMFDLFERLPPTDWFEAPYDRLRDLAVCTKSGYRASPLCSSDTISVHKNALTKSTKCPYHIMIHLDEKEQFRVDAQCYPADKIKHRPQFVLPPSYAHYYKKRHIEYPELPDFADGCHAHNEIPLEIIYPKEGAEIFLPRDLLGKKTSIVVQAAHSKSNATIYWHLDKEYIGSTRGDHQMAISPPKGQHTLLLVDEYGQEYRRSFKLGRG